MGQTLNKISALSELSLAIDVIIVGGGAAACMAALEATSAHVLLICDGSETASHWSKGGIAAAVAKNDSPSAHTEDTLAAGAGFADEAVVQYLTEDAPELIADLVELGVQFDRDETGAIELGREGRHRFSRILTSGGDSFGKELMRVLWQAVLDRPHITILSPARVYDLVLEGDQVTGVMCEDMQGGYGHIYATHGVVLATGGLGQLYAHTTNPNGACGLGVAMAAKAGAKLTDLEFVQFHPTAIDVPVDPKPLASEAIRGAGAHLINDEGERFMLGLHEFKELAPRDIVSRAIGDQVAAGSRVYLDCRPPIFEDFASRFPFADTVCKAHGIDPAIKPIPIMPAAHYHMGGIAVESGTGRTSIDGLWACGEVACTGMHGANRLASNSLLEALLTGRQCGLDVTKIEARAPRAVEEITPLKFTPSDHYVKLRQLMSSCLGVVRREEKILEALTAFKAMRDQVGGDFKFGLMLRLSNLMAMAALLRQESRGGHFRSDYPDRQAVPSDLSVWQRALTETEMQGKTDSYIKHKSQGVAPHEHE